MTDWLTVAAAAKRLKVSTASVFYYLKTGRIQHRHTFTRQGRRTEVRLPEKIRKLSYGEVRAAKAQAKCAECQR